MTHRLTTNYAKNYCNRTLIVKVIVENVVTCFLGPGVFIRFIVSFHFMCHLLYRVHQPGNATVGPKCVSVSLGHDVL